MKNKTNDHGFRNQQQVEKYEDIIALAESAEAREDYVMARQHRKSAEEFADTRMSAAARKMAGAK